MTNADRQVEESIADELLVANWLALHAEQTLREMVTFKTPQIPLKAVILPRPDGKNSAYDITIETQLIVPITLEVKVDYKGRQTGNLYIELATPDNVPKGLADTEADLWAHFIPPQELVVFRPYDMVQLVGTYLDKGYTLKNYSGDGNAKGIVIPLQDVLAHKWVRHFRVPLPVRRSYDDEPKSPDNRGGPAGDGPPRARPINGEAQDARGGPGRDLGRARTGR